GLQVAMLGAGRMGRSIATELALSKAKSIVFYCTDRSLSGTFFDDLRRESPLSECRVETWPDEGLISLPERCDLLVNATPIGRHDPTAELPLDLALLSADAAVLDVVFNPPTTRLAREARRRGLLVFDGLDLLVEQAAVAFEIWTEVQPDRDAMREAVEEFLVL
ncbi:MAG: shikimate dehydrogenase, partial [Planctomycetota bacterium]